MRTVIVLLLGLGLAFAAPAAASAAERAKPAEATTPTKKQQRSDYAYQVHEAKKYVACMNLADKKPSDAFEQALEWKGLGGGAPAEHCAAKALIGMKQYADAAKRLEKLGNDTHLKVALRARLMEQAAQAWLLDNKPARSEAAANAALKLQPDTVEFLIDRAQAKAALHDYKGAIQDLTAAAKKQPERADIYTFRASAHRLLGQIRQARADIVHALNLDPAYPDALLELGNLKRLAGENAHAREAWLRVLDIAPNSAAAKDARANIERMDVNTGGEAKPAQKQP